MSTILFIDGENLRHYIEDVLKQNGHKDKNINDIDLSKLLDNVLKGIKIVRRTFYSAKLHVYQEDPKYLRKSKDLVRRQRILKTELEKNGFVFVISGHVRTFKVRVNSKEAVVFKEKGVDVRIAVDLVSSACDKKIDTAVLCSSDSDLQPAVKEARARGLKIIYLGFEINPNKGLMYTTNRSIIIRNSEILDALKIKK
ncbi:MAG: NYN domain-containing protein [Patescibacteria group bacterium]